MKSSASSVSTPFLHARLTLERARSVRGLSSKNFAVSAKLGTYSSPKTISAKGAILSFYDKEFDCQEDAPFSKLVHACQCERIGRLKYVPEDDVQAQFDAILRELNDQIRADGRANSMRKEYKTIREVVGPLMLVEQVSGVKYGELVEIEQQDGSIRRGRVLEIGRDQRSCSSLKVRRACRSAHQKARFLGRASSWTLRPICGRIFRRHGQAIDEGPTLIPEKT